MVTHSSLMSYFSQSFVPCKFSRLCVLGVDIVGVPVVLVVGLPRSKVSAVAGWLGLRVALTGLCYLEYRWELAAQELKPEIRVEKGASRLPITGPVLPVANLELPVTVAELPENSEVLKLVVCEGKTLVESDQVEFPRMESEPMVNDEGESDSENGGRASRKISLRSVDSSETTWSECQTPDRMTVELPVELTEETTEMETPRPGEERWFTAAQDEVLVKPKSEPEPEPELKPKPKPERKVPPPRRKHSKYGSCPLVLRKSTASLHVSAITAKTEAT